MLINQPKRQLPLFIWCANIDFCMDVRMSFLHYLVKCFCILLCTSKMLPSSTNLHIFTGSLVLFIYLFVFFPSSAVVHCRCSKCYSVPARKRVRKRSPSLTLLSLPEEILLCVLQCLSAEDLLSVRAVSKDGCI